MNEEAKHFAARVKKLAGDDVQQRIRHAFELALGRAPTELESNRLHELMKSAEIHRRRSTHWSAMNLGRVDGRP